MKNSNRIIAVSALVTAAMMILANVQRHNVVPPPRTWIGYGAAFTITSVFADLGSPIGGGLAALIMVTAMANYGVDAFGLVAARSAKEPLTPASGTGRTGGTGTGGTPSNTRSITVAVH